MARLSTRSNPTNLKTIDKRRISIAVSEMSGHRYFNVIRLDLEGLALDKDNLVVCVAEAGKTSVRFEIGTVALWTRKNLLIDELDQSESLRFRILVHPQNDPLLTASAESIRPADDSQNESLIPMEPADLGQLLWQLDINDEGPVLKFNKQVFPSAQGIENYLPFGAFVLPEALRRIMETIAKEPERLNDESDSLRSWAPWLDSLGIDRPTGNDDERTWSNDVVNAFCSKHLFASRLIQQLELGGSAHD